MPRSQSTNPNSATSMRTSAMPPITRRADGTEGTHSKAQNCPPRSHNGDHEHDGRFHQFGHSRPDSRDNPHRANGSKHEACSEYEREIEHASFHNPHDSSLPLSASPIVATPPRATRTTIGYEQNTS